jgi:hypothetical protein
MTETNLLINQTAKWDFGTDVDKFVTQQFTGN